MAIRSNHRENVFTFLSRFTLFFILIGNNPISPTCSASSAYPTTFSAENYAEFARFNADFMGFNADFVVISWR